LVAIFEAAAVLFIIGLLFILPLYNLKEETKQEGIELGE